MGKFLESLYGFAFSASDIINAGTAKAKVIAPKLIDTVGDMALYGVYSIPRTANAIIDFMDDIKEQVEDEDSSVVERVMNVGESVAGSIMDAVTDAVHEIQKVSEIGVIPPKMEIKYAGKIYVPHTHCEHWCYSGDDTQSKVYKEFSKLLKKLELVSDSDDEDNPDEEDAVNYGPIVTDYTSNIIKRVDVRFTLKPDAVTVIAEDESSGKKFKIPVHEDELDELKYHFELADGTCIYCVTAYFIDQDKPYVGHVTYNFVGIHN